MEGKSRDTASIDEAIELPLVKLTKTDLYGSIFVNTNDVGETFNDALLKLQTWIMNYSEDMVSSMRSSGVMSDEEIEVIKRGLCVISPITLSLYLTWMQRDTFSKMTDSEKERFLLEKSPDRFKARFKGNASCRNARETSPDEESEASSQKCTIEDKKSIQNMSFVEFLELFGKEVRKEME